MLYFRVISSALAALAVFCVIGNCAADDVDAALSLEPIELLGDARLRHAASITHIQPLADGRRALTSSRDGSIRLWNLVDGRELRRFQPEKGEDIWNVKLLPGEREFLSCGEDHHVTRWNLKTGEIVARYKLPATGMRLAIVPGGKQFVACDSGRHASLWDIQSGQRLRVFKGHSDAVYSAAVSPDGKICVTGGEDGSVRAWEIATGNKLWVIEKEANPDARKPPWEIPPIAPAAGAFELALDEPEAPKQPKKVPGPGHFEDVFTVCFLPDGKRVVSCSEDSAVSMWNATDGKRLWSCSVSDSARVVACSPDGTRLAVTADDGMLHILSTKDGKSLRTIKVPGRSHWPITWSPDGAQLLSGGGNLIHCWDAETGEQLFPPPANDHVKGAMQQIAVSPDGRRLYAADDDETILIWDLPTGKRIAAWKTDDDVRSLEVTPDGSRLLVVHGERITLRDATNGERIWQIDSEETLRHAKLAADGKTIIATRYDRSVVAYRTADGRLLYALKTEDTDNQYNNLIVSSDGSRSYLIGENFVEARKVSDGSPILRYPNHGNEPRVAVLLPDDRAMLLFSDESEAPLLSAFIPVVNARAAPMPAAEFQKLSTKLGHDDFATREVAMLSLIQGGPTVLSQLANVHLDDNEVRWRIAKIRDQVREGLIPTQALEPVNLSDEVEAATAHPKLARWAMIKGRYTRANVMLGQLDEKALTLGKPASDGHSAKCLAFSADGQRLFTGNRDGTISVYRVK